MILEYKSNKKLILRGLLAVLFLVVLTGCGQRKASFKKPDIKDDFCGVVINYQYCKCAFHNDFCDVVGLTSSTANWYVHNEFNRYFDFLYDRFKSDCSVAGGKVLSRNVCTYCDEPSVWNGNKCGSADDLEQGDEDVVRSDFVPDGPFNADCTINEGEFNDNWKKYSDLEGPMEVSDRSWEAQQVLGVYDRIMALKIENFQLEYDMEIDRQIRLELREYRDKLVHNQKQNLIKALIRLTYVTYNTIDSGKGAAGSFGEFLTGTEVLARAGGLISTVRTFIPSGSKVAIDTNTTGGKALSVGLSTAIEAMEKMGDPKDVAMKLITESRNAALPSADISPEEIEILRTQHLRKQGIDAALAESYLINSQRRSVLQGNLNEISQLEAELSSWEAKEKARIKMLLENQCAEAKKQYDEKN